MEDVNIDDTTTDAPEETLLRKAEETSSIVRRSVNEDKIIFTRRGVYELIESRLSLELSPPF